MKWEVPKIWKGGECWIIGGGPSIVQQFGIPSNVVEGVRVGDLPTSVYSPYLSVLHDKHVVGVNTSFMLGNWVDMLFFGDNKFYLHFEQQVNDFPNLKVTCSSNANSRSGNNKHIKYLSRSSKSRGLTKNRGQVCWNVNSGAAAINVALHTGVKRVILLGFDMKLDSKQRQHWHDYYTKKGQVRRKLPFDRHLIGFDDIKKDADRFGLEIINANPDSALNHFPKVNVKELL